MIVDPNSGRYSKERWNDIAEWNKRHKELKKLLFKWICENKVTVEEWRDLQQGVSNSIEAAVDKEEICIKQEKN